MDDLSNISTLIRRVTRVSLARRTCSLPPPTASWASWPGHRCATAAADTTALGQESYLRFLNVVRSRSDDRHAFFAYASRAMRTVLIDAVRERQAERRGGNLHHLTLNTPIADTTCPLAKTSAA